MKILIASDLHGSAYWTHKLEEVFEKEQPERLILLGDLLYHGPRNPLPDDYRPPEVARILNALKDRICAVHGNCDSDVDQMVLEFPIGADYMIWYDRGTLIYTTHGHLWNTEIKPLIGRKDILLHGHTHVPVAEDCGSFIYLNPGSVSLPKDGWPNSYMIYENGTFRILSFDGRELKHYTVHKES